VQFVENAILSEPERCDKREFESRSDFSSAIKDFFSVRASR
jgi:hypothetical protein